MKKIYSLLFAMLLAFVGAGSANAQETYTEGYVSINSLNVGDIVCYGVTITGKDEMDYYGFYPSVTDMENFDGITTDEDEYTIGQNGLYGVMYSTYFDENSKFSFQGYNMNYGEYQFFLVQDGGDSGDDNPDKDLPEYPITAWGERNGKFYSTIMLGKNWTVPAGYTTYYVNENLELITYVVGGDIIKGSIAAANVPVIIESDNNDPLTIYTTTESSTGHANNNQLRGVLVNTPIPAEANVKFYKLAYNASHENLGFYWDNTTNDSGATINAQAHKAYLRVENAGSNYLSLRFEDTLTAIESVSTQAPAQSIYNLWGQRTNAQNGIVINGGKKMMVK